MGIKITSVSMHAEPCELPTNGPHRMLEAGSVQCTGEFESTVELKVGQRFAVNENRFEGLAKDDGSMQGVARVTSVRKLPLQSPVEISTFLIPRQWRPRDERTWTGTFEMECEVAVVAND